MKTSSVTFNIMIIVGCVLVFMVTIPILLIYGANQYNINKTEFTVLCQVSTLSASLCLHVAVLCRHIVFWITLDLV